MVNQLEDFVYELERINDMLTMIRDAIAAGNNDYMTDNAIENVLMQLEFNYMDVTQRMKNYCEKNRMQLIERG